MRKLIAGFFILLLIGFLGGCAKTVAVVNGQSISQKELDHELEKAGGKNMLENLIGRKLVEEDADAKHITVSDQEIDKQLDEVKKSLNNTDQQSLTPERLKLLRDDIRFNILLRKAIMAKIPESEVKAYFDKNKDVLPEVELSAIVVSDPKQAKAIVEELHRAKEFEAMARQFTLDPAGRERGGYVGYASKGNLQQLSPEIAKAAFDLNPGEISGVLKTSKGYYILKVLNKRITYADLKDEIDRQMAGDRAKSYLDDLKTKAKIDYKGEYAQKQ